MKVMYTNLYLLLVPKSILLVGAFKLNSFFFFSVLFYVYSDFSLIAYRIFIIIFMDIKNNFDKPF